VVIDLEDVGSAVDYRGCPQVARRENQVKLEEIARAVCNAADTSIAELQGRSRSPNVAVARKVFAILAAGSLDHRVADVAAFLRKHAGSVSRYLETPTDPGDGRSVVKHLLDEATANLDSSPATL
jgi:hypothetical protein